MTDPVRANRRRVARYVKLAKRVGYLLLLAAVVLVVIGLAQDLPSGLVTAATVCLVAASVLLAPAIVLGYAVNAAERDDRQRGF
jgi:4-hydroxybenzoate polyprenyltransferase